MGTVLYCNGLEGAFAIRPAYITARHCRHETQSSNAERERPGYDRVTLLGWAARPYYDPDAHKLHWAKEYRFGDVTAHTLNCDVRVFVRRGVFSTNFITIMEDLPLIEGSIPHVLEMPTFNDGARYSDHVPGTDKIAASGIGGLIAGKVLSKAGLLAVLLGFLKKGWVVILVVGGVVVAGVRKLFAGRGSRP